MITPVGIDSVVFRIPEMSGLCIYGDAQEDQVSAA